MDEEHSQAFKEFVAERYDEILLSDKKYLALNQMIIDLELTFKKTLSKQQLQSYDEIEDAVIECSAYGDELLCQTLLLDKWT
jgi:hypothetical protein